MKIRDHRELDVFKIAFNASMEIYELSKEFPKYEMYSLTDQIRRSSRSVCANISEAFRKRKYPKAFIAKLSDSESEAAETQTWIEYCYKCEYMNKENHDKLIKDYDHILGKLVNMAIHPEQWSY